MRIRVLGELELRGQDGAACPAGGRRQLTLLGLLVSEANRPIPHARLIDLLWPENPPMDPGSALHNAVFRLRRALAPTGATVLSRPSGYQLSVARADVDALAFEDVAHADSSGSAELLRQGLRLWRGEPYLGLHDVPPLRYAAAGLVDLKLSWLKRVAVRLLETGDHATAEAYLRRAAVEAPLREPVRLLLMASLDRAGRTTDALAEYRAYRTLLAEETGLDPSPEMEAAHRRLLGGGPGGGGSGAGPGGGLSSGAVPAVDPPARRLAGRPPPEPLAPIVGREREAVEVCDLIARGHRLVTLTGGGGVGKTRLAIEVARRKWAGESVFVDLAEVTSPDDVADAFARAVGAALTSADPVADLAAEVGDQELLLVVDNFEHVLVRVDLVADLLARCGGIRALVTSRQPLAVPGEREYAVAPLAVPAADAGDDEVIECASVALFLDRVADPALAVPGGPDTVRGIGRLCRELGGLPLAIELAAALARFRSLDDVFASVVASLRDGGSAASAKGRDEAGAEEHGAADPRSRALEWAIRWSYDRLGEAERTALGRLAAFAGPFDAGAIVAVCGGPSPQVVHRLVGLGLVTPHRARSRMRYTVPGIVAAYARLRQAPVDRSAAEAAHFRYVAGLCRDPRWLDDDLLLRVDDAYQDVLRALRWGAGGPTDDPRVVDVATALVLYWLWRGSTHTAIGWLDRLRPRLAAMPTSAARLDVLLSAFLRNAGRLDEASRAAVASCTALDDPDWLVTGRLILAAIAHDRSDAHEVVRCARAAAEVAESGAPRRLPEVLGALALGYAAIDDSTSARREAVRALSLLDGVRSAALRAATRMNAAQALVEAGHEVLALEVLTAGRAELSDSPDGALGYYLALGWAQHAAGEHDGALATFREMLHDAVATGQWRWVAELLTGCACTLLHAGRVRESALALGGAERLLQRFDVKHSPWIRRRTQAAYATIARHPRGREWVDAGGQLGAGSVVDLVSADVT